MKDIGLWKSISSDKFGDHKGLIDKVLKIESESWIVKPFDWREGGLFNRVTFRFRFRFSLCTAATCKAVKSDGLKLRTQQCVNIYFLY